jgi:hypothetical protein
MFINKYNIIMFITALFKYNFYIIIILSVYFKIIKTNINIIMNYIKKLLQNK